METTAIGSIGELECWISDISEAHKLLLSVNEGVKIHAKTNVDLVRGFNEDLYVLICALEKVNVYMMRRGSTTMIEKVPKMNFYNVNMGEQYIRIAEGIKSLLEQIDVNDGDIQRYMEDEINHLNTMIQCLFVRE